MTATSAFAAFPTMEVPAIDDSMEMASPYQGQVDDFDIDLDLMDDHVSNMDSDMMVAEDYPATSHPAYYNNDADMADGLSERSMVDDGDNFANEDNDVEVQYQGEQTVETEMLEGDADEDIDAPVPTIHIEKPAAAQDETNNPSLTSTAITDKPVEETPEDTNHLAQTTPAEASTQDFEDHDQSIHQEQSTAEKGPTEHFSEKIETAQPEITHELLALAEETNEAAYVDTAKDQDIHAHLESPIENAEAVAEDAEHLEAHPKMEQEDHGAHSDASSLHPVKVLYQENEISLFPPLEGDSSETFFLQDENVAFDDFGKLFRAFREVLQDNVAENEILVIDIDSLGIQMTEDSSCISKVSLHQVLDLYLKLCHNDGANEPEAFYLTLSSRLSVSAEIADLWTAASEGKGLSQILSWEEYDEVNAFEDETWVGQEHIDSSDESGPRAHESHDQQEEDLQTGDDEISDAEGNGVHVTAQSDVASGEAEQDEANFAEHLNHQEENLPLGEEYTNEETYDSEGHGSESTSTVVPLSRSAEFKVPDEDVSADIAQEDPVEDEHADFPEGEDLGDEAYSGEGGANDIVDGHEEFEDDLVGNDIVGTGVGDDPLPAELTSAAVDHEEDADAPHAAPEYEDTVADVSQDHLDDAAEDQSESISERVPQNAPAGLESTDDLLGIANDLLQTPAQIPPNEHPEPADAIEEVDFLEEFDVSETVEDDDAADTHFDDDNQYIEATEANELDQTSASFADSQPHDTVSGKRSRGDEEAWDAVEDTKPEIKKRRAS